MPQDPLWLAISWTARHPLGLVGAGAFVIVASYVFLDRYNPYRGLVGNAISGTVEGLPYRWLFAIGSLLIVVGGVLVFSRK